MYLKYIWTETFYYTCSNLLFKLPSRLSKVWFTTVRCTLY